jgi:hypothetical protein
MLESMSDLEPGDIDASQHPPIQLCNLSNAGAFFGFVFPFMGTVRLTTKNTVWAARNLR